MIFDSSYSHCDKKQPIVVSAENKNRHILINTSGFDVFQYHIDGEIITDTKMERCDYIVEVNDQTVLNAYMIELKGSDLNKALRQIQSTINMLGNRIKSYRVLPRVIMHKVPTHHINGNVYRNFKRKYPELEVRRLEWTDCV